MFIQDGFDDFFADGDTKLYWVSFLHGMQRVLLFTEDIAIATVAQQVSMYIQLYCMTVIEKVSMGF